jgi:hypothetical protein
MNTPAGKPLNPIDPVADVSHERAGPERQKSEPDNDPFRSPYAPKKAHERAGAERHPVENTHDPRRPAYAPKSAKQPTVESDFGRNEVSAPPPQPAQPNSGRQERPAAGRDDETWSDLERLEAGVRRVQRNQTTAPLPRATPRAPVPRLPPAGQVFDHGLRSPRSLEPKRLVPPGEMMSRRDRLRWPVRIFITSIFAAPIAYYFSV